MTVHCKGSVKTERRDERNILELIQLAERRRVPALPREEAAGGCQVGRADALPLGGGGEEEWGGPL